MLLASLFIAIAAPASTPAPIVGPPLLPVGTPVRVMVLNEVSSRAAHAGDSFVIIVDQPVIAAGRIVIPAGTRGRGEIIEAIPSGGGGKSGRISARLTSLDLNGRSIAISGGVGGSGSRPHTGALLAASAASPLTPLARGFNGVIKAGEILDAELAEAILP